MICVSVKKKMINITTWMINKSHFFLGVGVNYMLVLFITIEITYGIFFISTCKGVQMKKKRINDESVFV